MRFMQLKNLHAKILDKYSFQIDATLCAVNINLSNAECQFSNPIFHLLEENNTCLKT